MNNLVQAIFQPSVSPFSFRGDALHQFRPAQSITEKDLAVSTEMTPGYDISLGKDRTITTIQGKVQRSITYKEQQGRTFEERVFDALVLLKVAVSEYAMHLDASERRKIFEDLDDVLNVEDWHDGDRFPEIASFRAFLKWAVYASFREWTSLGVSDDGNVLLAWQTDRGLLTANFASTGDVRWTAKITSLTGVEYAAGRSTPQYFAKQARFYLEGTE
jgi:hypothetical protein